MDASTFDSRWHHNHEAELTALTKKHEGEVRELQGFWCPGRGETHNFLYDPQFACNQGDYLMCKGMAKGLGQSRFRREYEIMWGWHRHGPDPASKGTTKGEQVLAVGSQGKNADGEYSFRNHVLQLRHDGSWQHRAGIAITLPHLFLHLGREYTAAELYGYFNTLETLVVKRPHSWGNPVRQEAAAQRWKNNKGRGRGFAR